MSVFRYKAFISYSHKDEALAKWLHRSLETYALPAGMYAKQSSKAESQIPRRPFSPIFRDQEELVAATSLSDAILAAITDSEFLIVICSPSARDSHWVGQEVTAFKQLRSAEKVIAVLAEGDSSTSFPRSLLQNSRVDGSYFGAVLEPLAADLQGGRSKRRLALHKLAAAMLEVDLDLLVQREQQRRIRFLSLATSAAILAVVAMGWLTLTAVKEGREADNARASAEQSALIADQRRRQSEELLSFMVGDLRESLQPLGKLALLDRVGDKAVAYFDSLDAEAINDRSLLLQSEVLTQVGEIRMWQFQYDTAIEAFQQAHRYADLLVQRRPNDGDRLFRRSQAEYWIGDMHWRNGDLDQAQYWLESYQQSSLRLNELNPARGDWLMEVAYGHHNLGVLAMERLGLDTAQALFAEELEILKRLERKNDSELEVRENLSDTYSWLGKIAFRKGKLDNALDHFEKSISYLQGLLAESPDDSYLKLYFAANSGFRAEIYAISDRIDESRESYEQLLAMLSSMVQSDVENVQKQRYFARLQVDRAELALSGGPKEEIVAAKAAVQKGLMSLRGLHAAEPEDQRTLVGLVKGLRVAATLDLLEGLEDSAFRLASESVDLNTANFSQLELTREFGLAMVVARYSLVGKVPPEDWESKTKEQELAFREYAEALNDPLVRDAYARMLNQEGCSIQAEAIFSELAQMGYKPIWPWSSI